jgi:hypothetical protein
MILSRRRLAMRRSIEKILLNLPVSLFLALATPLLSLVTGVATGVAHTYLFTSLCCSGLLLAASAWLRQSQTGEYKDAAQRMARTLSGGGLPVLLELGRICRLRPDQAAGQVDALVGNVLTTARQMCGYVKHREEVHAVFYVAHGKDFLKLSRDTWSMAGMGSPRTELGAGGERDQEFVQFVLNAYGPPMQILVAEDLNTKKRSPLDILFIGNCGYRSAMAATVGLGSNVEAVRWGVIVVTSPEKAAFVKSDGESLRLMAGVLAAGLAHAY